jgi:hypothetical protein
MMAAADRAEAQSVPVTLDNFTRAETDSYFSKHTADGGFGQFFHNRAPTRVEYQPVIRMNRDTLYSVVVLDLTEPATVVLPDAGGRFLSMMVVNQDHFVKYVSYAPGEHTLTQALMGTRYVEVIVRVFVDADDAADIAAANAIQEGLAVRQKAQGGLALPAWDAAALGACRQALLALGPFIPDGDRTFGDEGEVDPVRHLVGTAWGWGANPKRDAMYTMITPARNDGQTPYVLRVRDVPVDGFWSITVYNAKGYLEENEWGAYALNNVTATPDADGGYTVHFGGDPSAPNFLAIMPGWNYTVRLYRPRAEIVEGAWVFPEAVVRER